MTKEEIVGLFITKGVLSSKSGLIRRPFCWRSRYDEESKEIFETFASSYRSQEEAWFCLCRNVEPSVCPICKERKVVFTGLTKYGGTGFNTTCELCSANAVLEKKQKFRDKISKKTAAQRMETKIKREKTNKIRYGDSHHMLYGSKSFKDLMVKRYGDEHYANKEAAKRTCLKKYGVACNLSIKEVADKARKASWSEECRKKRVANSLKKTGFVSHCCLKDVQEKMQKTKKNRISEIERKNNCKLLASVTRKYGSSYKRLGLEYLRFGNNVFVRYSDLNTIEAYYREGTHTNNYTSIPEKEVVEFVRSIYGGLIEENCTNVVSNGNHRYYELDIWIPELNLAIDFDGSYWHSIKYKDAFYHHRKTEFCRKVGVRMIHVFEDEWRDRRENIKRIIHQCIRGEFRNVIGTIEDKIIGDNAYPIFGDYDIIEISHPEERHDGKSVYHDCGKIFYKLRGIRENERCQH